MKHPARIHEPGERLDDDRVTAGNQVKPRDCLGIRTRASARRSRYAREIEEIAEHDQIRRVSLINGALTGVVEKSGKGGIVPEQFQRRTWLPFFQEPATK